VGGTDFCLDPAFISLIDGGASADRARCRRSGANVFKVLAVVVALYVAYALGVGKVYARRGPWGVAWTRSEHPFWYWSTIVIYMILSAALMFVF
jgi:hypothetical protein